MWRAAGLEEPGQRQRSEGQGRGAGRDEEGEEEEVDNLAAGAFFSYFGRDQPARPTVIPNHTTRTMQGGGIPTVAQAPRQDGEMSDSSDL